MKDIFIVMKFTMKEMIKRKSFIISTLIILMMIVIGFNIPNIIKSFDESYGSGGGKILIVDSENVFENTLETLNQMSLGHEFEISNEKLNIEDVKEKIKNMEVEEAALIEENGEKIKITYIMEDTTMISGVPLEIETAFETIFENLKISKLGLTESQIQSLVPNFEFELKQVEEKEVGGNVLAIMLMSIVLFYAIYFCAYQVSSSITTEKTSKIMETLVTSTSPRNIVLGKTMGIGLIGLLQLIVIIATALVCANAFVEKTLIESVLDLSNITPFLGVITIVYFILGYLAYALLYALTGSTVSKPEDIQSANSPIALVAVAGFYLSYFTMMSPTSSLNFLASILPISSPFCMPFRIMMGLADGKDIALSILVLIITIIAIAKIAIKIYSNAILNYGTKMSFNDIVKMYKEK